VVDRQLNDSCYIKYSIRREERSRANRTARQKDEAPPGCIFSGRHGLIRCCKLALFVATLFACAQLSPTACLGAGALSVLNNEFISDGSRIDLRGVAMGDVLLARKEEHRPVSDYSRIARGWKANVVRLSILPSVWKYNDKEYILGLLEQEAAAALAEGMFVIITWHVIGWPDGYYPVQPYGTDDPADMYDSDFTLAKDFWDKVSGRFGAEGRIMFELWNEPIYSENEYPALPDRWPTLKPYLKQLTEIIRTHSNNVVLATGNLWAYDLRGIKDDLLPDPQTAYAWHVYAGHDDNKVSLWEEKLDGLDKVRPVMVTEWGFQRFTTEQYRGTALTFGLKFVIGILMRHGLGSTAWCWNPFWGPALVRPDWATPTAYGAFVRFYLRHAK